MERLDNAVNQIKIYQLCYHCDHYDEDNMECNVSCNCVKEVSNQIAREIISEFVDYLDNNAFELRHDMEEIRRWATEYKEWTMPISQKIGNFREEDKNV